jgi:1-deoxy-D-xylulose-5-phosphate synthase
MNIQILDTIKKPSDVQLLSQNQLTQLASEIREFLISTISKTGGHIGANLGVVELTIALHYCFNFELQPLLFDVGHQGYTHKLITGRKSEFSTLNEFKGMSRFITNKESKYDILDSSHAGTVIAISSGIAYARKQDGVNSPVVAIIGDGSLVEGMSFEGLNFACEEPLPLIIVINDNGMSIPQNVGGIHNLFEGKNWQDKSRAWFEGMGFSYESVADGHDFSQLTSAFTKAVQHVKLKTVVIHVKTEKGKGLELAKKHLYKMHFSMPFDPVSGAGVGATLIGETFQATVGDVLTKHMKSSDNIYAITPATPYASGLETLMEKFPNRAIDVGMAEQHAVGMAAGLAIENKQVFACFQSTFMQRAMDQIFHDICYPNLPVTIISARSGFAGFDSPTHHGIYDFAYLRALPNLKIFYAGTKRDLISIMECRLKLSNGPMVILHPYELILENEEEILPNDITPINLPELICKGDDGLIITMGNCIQDALDLRDKMICEKRRYFSVINLRWLQPLPESELLKILKNMDKIITMEESVKEGGMGSAINQFIRDKKLSCDIFVSAIEREFFPAGDKNTLRKISKIDVDSIFEKITDRWG